MELLFHHYFTPLVVFANCITGKTELSKDLVQDILVEIWEKKLFRKFRPESLGPFLRTLVRHKCIDASRKKDTLAYPVPIEKIEVVWDEYIDQHDRLVPLILKEIEQLPPRSREVVRMVYARKMKYREAADALGISVNTVKTLLHKSLEQIRSRLDPACLVLFFRG